MIHMLSTAGPRTSLRLGAVAIAVTITASLTGCATLATPVSNRPSGTASAGTQSTPRGQSTTAASGQTRAQLLAALPKRPATALPWLKAQEPSAIGALTAEQFIKADYTPTAWSDEPGIQQARGLQFAARQNWYDPSTGTYVDTFIIHYATATGADSDYLALVQSDAKNYDAHGSFTVPGIPQSTVYVRTKLDTFGNAAAVGLALAGDNVLRVYMLTPAAPNHPVMISLLTGEQQALKHS